MQPLRRTQGGICGFVGSNAILNISMSTHPAMVPMPIRGFFLAPASPSSNHCRVANARQFNDRGLVFLSFVFFLSSNPGHHSCPLFSSIPSIYKWLDNTSMVCPASPSSHFHLDSTPPLPIPSFSYTYFYPGTPVDSGTLLSFIPGTLLSFIQGLSIYLERHHRRRHIPTTGYALPSNSLGRRSPLYEIHRDTL